MRQSSVEKCTCVSLLVPRQMQRIISLVDFFSLYFQVNSKVLALNFIYIYIIGRQGVEMALWYTTAPPEIWKLSNSFQRSCSTEL